MIKVITQTTKERQEETRQLYEKVLPYLNEGYGLAESVRIVTGTRTNLYGQSWFRELRDYVRFMG